MHAFVDIQHTPLYNGTWCCSKRFPFSSYATVLQIRTDHHIHIHEQTALFKNEWIIRVENISVFREFETEGGWKKETKNKTGAALLRLTDKWRCVSREKVPVRLNYARLQGNNLGTNRRAAALNALVAHTVLSLFF